MELKTKFDFDNEIKAIMYHCKQHNKLPKGRKSRQGALRYILDFDLRILPIAPEYRSVAAEQLRLLISTDNLNGYDFRKTFRCDIPDAIGMPIPTFLKNDTNWENINIETIEGQYYTAKNKPRWALRRFNSLFIGEHTTPTSDIITALLQAEIKSNGDDEKFFNDAKTIISKICITQMLRIEDRRITATGNRVANMVGEENVYDYFINTPKDIIYKELCDYCYTDLSIKNTPETSIYNDVLKISEEYSFAKAANLSEKYTIKTYKY